MKSVNAFDFVCAHASSLEYSPNVLNFIHAIQIYYRMFRIENGVYRTVWYIYVQRRAKELRKINGQRTIKFKIIFQHIYTELNIMKLTRVIHMYKNIFTIKNDINIFNFIYAKTPKDY